MGTLVEHYIEWIGGSGHRGSIPHTNGYESTGAGSSECGDIRAIAPYTRNLCPIGIIQGNEILINV
jgi:hypothetical protein